MSEFQLCISAEEPTIIVGDQAQSRNRIPFRIRIRNDGPVWLKMEIPVGESGLVRDQADAREIRARVSYPGMHSSHEDFRGEESDGCRSGWLGDGVDGIGVGGELEIAVDIENIKCNAEVGQAEISVQAYYQVGQEVKQNTEKIAVRKLGEDLIGSFRASPDVLIGAGSVLLSWESSARTTINQPPHTQVTESGDNFMRVEVSETARFILKAIDEDSGRVDELELDVKVLKPGWNRIDMPEKRFPAVLFDSGDAYADWLYAILIDGDKKSALALYRSRDGLVDWEKVGGALPDYMETSPGIRLGDHLYLIGGSMVDQDLKSAEVFCFNLRDPAAGWTRLQVTGEFEARMGHAAVVTGERQAWILGGLGKFGPLNNTVALDLSPQGVEARSVTSEVKWGARCMPGAAVRQGEVWIAGGVRTINGAPLGDIWSRKVDKNAAWESRPVADAGYWCQGAIGSGICRLKGDQLLGLAAVGTGSRQKSIQPVSARLKRVTRTEDSWLSLDANRIDDDEEWIIAPHHISCVAFRGCAFARRMHANTPGKRRWRREPLEVFVSE